MSAQTGRTDQEKLERVQAWLYSRALWAQTATIALPGLAFGAGAAYYSSFLYSAKLSDELMHLCFGLGGLLGGMALAALLLQWLVPLNFRHCSRVFQSGGLLAKAMAADAYQRLPHLGYYNAVVRDLFGLGYRIRFIRVDLPKYSDFTSRIPQLERGYAACCMDAGQENYPASPLMPLGLLLIGILAYTGCALSNEHLQNLIQQNDARLFEGITAFVTFCVASCLFIHFANAAGMRMALRDSIAIMLIKAAAPVPPSPAPQPDAATAADPAGTHSAGA